MVRRRVTPRVRVRSGTRLFRNRTAVSRARVARALTAARRRLASRTASRTRTLTKKRRTTITNAQSHYSMSSVNYGMGRPRMIDKVANQMPPNTIVYNTGGFISATAGLQGVSDSLSLFGMFDDIDLNNMISQVKDQVSALIKNAFAEQQISYLIQHGHAEMTLKNDTNELNTVRIYDIICRRDTTREDPSGQRMYPYNMWQLGDYYSGRDGAVNQNSITNYQTPGATPFESKTFTSFYKVAKVTKIVMDPGSIHSHTVKWSPMRLWSNTNESKDLVGMKGLTVYSMVVAEGAPIYAETGGTNDVTTSPISIAVSIKKRITYQPILTTTPRGTFKNNLIGTPGQLIDAETGVKEPFTFV